MNDLERKYDNPTPNYYPTFKKGLAQAHVVIELIDLSKNILYNNTPTDRAIRKLFVYTSSYLNLRYPVSMDYCSACEYRLNKLQRISPEAKGICINILTLIRQGKSAKEIFSLVTKVDNNNKNDALPIPNLVNTKWITQYQDKSYILEFENPPIADLYEVDKDTLQPNTNMTCGIGYVRKPNFIEFSGGTHLVPTANFIKGELIDNKLYVYYTTLSPYREWITKELIFTPLSNEKDIKDAATHRDCVEVQENEVTTCGLTSPLELVVQKSSANPCEIPQETDLPIGWQIMKKVFIGIGVLVGIALLIFILSKLFIFGFAVLLGLSMLFAKK